MNAPTRLSCGRRTPQNGAEAGPCPVPVALYPSSLPASPHAAGPEEERRLSTWAGVPVGPALLYAQAHERGGPRCRG